VERRDRRRHPAEKRTKASDSDRARALSKAASSYLDKRWTVSLSTSEQIVLQRRKRMGWFWNTVLVIVTGGLWLIYVIYRALNRKTESVTLTVDEYGKVRKR
jgi:hypothetical protein